MKNIKKIFLPLSLFLFILLLNESYSQVYPYKIWESIYNAPSNLQDSAVGIVRNSAGMLFVTGWSMGSTTNKDIVALRLNPDNGDTIWVKRFIGPTEDIVTSIACDNNAVYVTGWTFSPGPTRDVITIKYNAANGDTLWVKKFNGPGGGGDYGWSVDVDNGGNVFVAGRTDVGGSQKYLILKYNSAGVQDTFIYRDAALSTTFDEARSIIADNSGNIYVTGTSAVQSGASDMLTLKLSTNPLSLVWAKKHTSPGNFDDHGIVVRIGSSLSNVYVGGWGRSTQDFIVIKYSASNGDSLAYAFYNGPTSSTDVLTGLTLDPNEDVYITGGSVNSPVSRYEFATVRYNPVLGQQWVARTFNPDGWDYPSNLTFNLVNSLYVTGYRTKAGQGTNIFIIRYNASTGDTIWTKMENGTANLNDYGTGIIAVDSLNIFLAGSAVFAPASTASIYTLKYMNQIVGIRPISTEIPRSFYLAQNYPNPFNPSTSIRFNIPRESFVKISVFDMLGREVEVIANEEVQPGKYEANWDASEYSSGVYFYRLTAGEFSDTKKMIVVK